MGLKLNRREFLLVVGAVTVAYALYRRTVDHAPVYPRAQEATRQQTIGPVVTHDASKGRDIVLETYHYVPAVHNGPWV